MKELTFDDVTKYAEVLADKILAHVNGNASMLPSTLYGVPRGGMMTAWAVSHMLSARGFYVPVQDVYARPPTPGDSKALVVDDIIDSGATLAKYEGFKFAALISRYHLDDNGPRRIFYAKCLDGDTNWIVFPWENESTGPEAAVRRLLQYMGRDPNEAGLVETPRRVLEWFKEFRENQAMPDITSFASESYDEMVIVRHIPFVSLCEHHLLPFSGTATVAYIPQPSENIIGLSKLARIVAYVTKRTGVQERFTHQIRQYIENATNSPNVAVQLQAEHMCMTLRGPHAAGSTTVTQSLGGSFKEDSRTRSEFLKVAQTR